MSIKQLLLIPALCTFSAQSMNFIEYFQDEQDEEVKRGIDDENLKLGSEYISIGDENDYSVEGIYKLSKKRFATIVNNGRIYQREIQIYNVDSKKLLQILRCKKSFFKEKFEPNLVIPFSDDKLISFNTSSSGKYKIILWSLESGKELKEINLPNDLKLSRDLENIIQINNSEVFIVAEDGKIYSLNLDSGNISLKCDFKVNITAFKKLPSGNFAVLINTNNENKDYFLWSVNPEFNSSEKLFSLNLDNEQFSYLTLLKNGFIIGFSKNGHSKSKFLYTYHTKIKSEVKQALDNKIHIQDLQAIILDYFNNQPDLIEISDKLGFVRKSKLFSLNVLPNNKLLCRDIFPWKGRFCIVFSDATCVIDKDYNLIQIFKYVKS